MPARSAVSMPAVGCPRNRTAARRRADQAGEHAERGRLAGPVRSHEREDLARAHVERHVLHGHARPERLAQRLGLEHQLTGNS
jgi:hypothetical protein